MIDNNLISANTLELCTGARSSYVSYNGEQESVIDHIILPMDKMDTILSCEIADDNALNVSNHRPVVCRVHFPCVASPKVYETFHHINWKLVKQEHIQQYEYNMNHDPAIQICTVYGCGKCKLKLHSQYVK